ncbi:hypothetical protein ANN_26291 [Periplaneta americana]|uniref:Uncharacterized protein n=1 Tax=Periplaneta americana TaxID=6978 RepID=A0ABQ8S5Y1_PERAM|nr:hypothetical protein ANN_26291 [Periplaneta americana]
MERNTRCDLLQQPASPADEPPPVPAVTLTITLPSTALPQTEMTASGLSPSTRGLDQQELGTMYNVFGNSNVRLLLPSTSFLRFLLNQSASDGKLNPRKLMPRRCLAKQSWPVANLNAATDDFREMKFRYVGLLLEKFQTDHLEARFGQYRQMSGGNCISEDGSNRGAGIVALNRQKKKVVILDPTVQFEKDVSQALAVDQEKQVIYRPCVPHLGINFRQEEKIADICTLKSTIYKSKLSVHSSFAWLVLLAQSLEFTVSRTPDLQRQSTELRTQVPQLWSTALELRASDAHTAADTLKSNSGLEAGFTATQDWLAVQ